MRINFGYSVFDPITLSQNCGPCNNCKFTMGDGTAVNGCYFFFQDSGTSISVGKNCMFSWGIDVWCTDAHTITDLEGNVMNNAESVEIGDHVWIGRDVKVGKNTKISSNSFVGWGSIVTHKFTEENVSIAGVPAKIVKCGINWSPLYKERYLESLEKK